ncbi:MAG: NADPH-dependent 7-cyano-7-deazaguanine reductase QueF [Alphaproteobacteria bacterium]|nr:NADPH-dependent 7-cyano-7-deazaguanine reductase QueF [Alphaproteobacteria bacterium]
MTNLVLGQKVHYPAKYNPSLLFPIPRVVNRVKIKLRSPFYGYDIWNCYEVSWLNPKGKPEVRILELYIPCDSPNLIESKSLKLYLFSFNNEKFASEEEVTNIIKSDISHAIGQDITVFMKKLNEYEGQNIAKPEGLCIDDLDIEINAEYSSSSLLKFNEEDQVDEIIYSNLHKSNCLVTHQPDWATMIISYKGSKLDHASVLEYIVSHREEDMFHEDSVEKIYADISNIANFERIIVWARYTRRGGIDINPIRSNIPIKISAFDNKRLARQ